MSRDVLYRLQVATTAALLVAAIRQGVIRSGPASAATDTGPTSDRADSSLPRPVVSVQ